MGEQSNDILKRKRKAELDWYVETPRSRGLSRRLLRHPIFFSLERVEFNYAFPKQQMAAVLEERLGGKVKLLLNAPSGRGTDFQYLKHLGEHVIGLDLSPLALMNCRRHMESAAADLLHIPSADDVFDAIAAPLFFHHFIHFGFSLFLEEFYRVLKPGGQLVVLEPSLWYPLNAMTRPLKTLFDNPFDEVEDEGPFRPNRMIRALEQTGFSEIEFQAASFSHPVFFRPVARLVNVVSRRFLKVWPLKCFGWLLVFSASKPR